MNWTHPILIPCFAIQPGPMFAAGVFLAGGMRADGAYDLGVLPS